MGDDLARAHRRCIAGFDELISFLSTNNGAFQVASQALLDLSDERNRYAVWALSAGAGHSGRDWKKSLDYRLRVAESYKIQVQPCQIPKNMF
jgi:hypothetical protein